ncbi:hypothetical protein BDW67DRAFT_171362 [Aspergillus spinulosporus]
MEQPCSRLSRPIPHRDGGRYMDPNKLILLLRKQFGASKFRVDLHRDQYIVWYVDYGDTDPCNLMELEAQIDTCRRRY